MQVAIHADTNIGKVREVNEDSYCVLEKTLSAYICDGMGGHVAGATASRLAIDTIIRVNALLNLTNGNKIESEQNKDLTQYLSLLNQNLESSLPELAINMINAIQIANHRLYRETLSNPYLQGMGTTVIGMAFTTNLCCIAHVGDSRAYRIRNQQMEQQTVDHSWLNELLQAGKIQPDEVQQFPHRNIITRALGVDKNVRTDIRIDPVQLNDIYLICSDGLHDVVPENDILATVLSFSDALDYGVKKLIEQANANGGKDNITVALAKVIAEDDEKTDYNYQETIPEESSDQSEFEEKILSVLLRTDVKMPEGQENNS